ncbi:MAG: hypothetical protein HYS86_05565 [Candidatus Chisholmbacteria bacterium]|nr:hypothetical protein [Candidatus Chisholmbacteria bacterium]
MSHEHEQEPKLSPAERLRLETEKIIGLLKYMGWRATHPFASGEEILDYLNNQPWPGDFLEEKPEEAGNEPPQPEIPT